MKTYFYSHLVKIDNLVAELDQMKLSLDEKNHLIELVHTNMHHTVLDTILSELSGEDKKTFLTHLSNDDHDKLWEHLHTSIENTEEKIQKTVDSLIESFRLDIQETKKHHEKAT